MPSTRSLARGGGLLALLALPGIAAAQSPGTTDLGVGAELAARFVGVLLVNGLLAGALVAFGPRYAARTVRDLRADPAGAFGWGLLVGIGGPIALALLAITIVGLVVAIPGALVLVVVGIVGQAVAIVWIGDAVVGSEDAPDGKSAGVGAVVLAVPFAIPVLGNLLSTLIGFFGIGVVGRGLYDSWTG